MKEIKLFGKIADHFGSDFSIDVKTPAEALRALDANMPGFIQYMHENKYAILLVDRDRIGEESAWTQITKENGLSSWGDENLVIIPTADGDIGVIIGVVAEAIVGSTTAAIGTAIGVSSLTVATAVATVIVYVAVFAIATLVSSAIVGDGDPADAEYADSKPSYIFNGPVNTTKQGHRMPILYGGPILVGSMVISARIITEDDPVSTKSPYEEILSNSIYNPNRWGVGGNR